MGDVQEIDVERIMERIRQDIKRRKTVENGAVSEYHVSPFDDGQASADFAYLHSGYDIQNVSFVSHRILAPFVVAIKRALRKLLTPVLQRQVAYNIANTRVSTHLKDWIGTLDRQHTLHLQALKGELPETILGRLRAEVVPQLQDEIVGRLRREVLGVGSQLRQELLAAQAQEIAAAEARLREESFAVELAARERISRAERKLRRILHALETGQLQHSGPAMSPAESGSRERSRVEPDFDYAGLEERFRGSEEEIKERQRIYVPYFEGRDHIVDIGCGRGEFLDLLREHGIKARGVDLDFDMILLCKEKGLDVIMEDALAYLETRPDDSIGGIFAAQVIEHLHPHRVIELVKLCHRKLAPDGVLILETPNPKCLMVFAETFYKDPSHIQPAHPDTMQFVLEATGFHHVEVQFLDPVDPVMQIPPLQAAGVDVHRFNAGIERLNSLLFGFRDYAVIGRKN